MKLNFGRIIATGLLISIATISTSFAGDKGNHSNKPASAPQSHQNTNLAQSNDPRIQLAIADAKAQYEEALAAATTPAEKKAAKLQFMQAIRAIKKAQGLTK